MPPRVARRHDAITPPDDEFIRLHDALFGGAFSLVAHVVALLRASLHPEIWKLFDWTTLRLLPDDFIDANLRRIQIEAPQIDLMFEVTPKIPDPTTARHFVILAHQTWPDRHMVLRLFQRSCHMLLTAARHAEGRDLQLGCLPVVVHLGQRPWPYSTDLECLYEDQASPVSWGGPRFEYVLLDHAGDPADFVGSPLGRATQLTMYTVTGDEEWRGKTFAMLAPLLADIWRDNEETKELDPIFEYLAKQWDGGVVRLVRAALGMHGARGAGRRLEDIAAALGTT